ncbi:MAG: competence/damage-inducible protein A [Clostridiales bacterium]|uniref:competence/damage-inducible protein A n=1 Tax=Terrisporobacter sp. TaxID=1965305 RepID=UPI002A4D8485|nr:competence/damage-inducible protein A [Terrisporobacter sp.]MCI5629933.1 competence/damage-inducible protein A [Clostridium sp.]MDD5877581.1 competence/damage-inducible protein A [Clostridiales bacterium]MCI6456785.1 competence/damage-inducible protein A [Clostridium sp.]MCI7204670.1 competence/damage-inducible protein A [Clostridium sp.]MDD7755171.1 competence/damage-inducible protein A [Clostridiales bacterium]
MKTEIITVGTEILLGDILNTNTHYLSNELANMGIDVYYQITVGDNEQRLLSQLKESFKRSDLVILTGGLGPTEDDITKEVCAKYFNMEMEFHEQSWDKIIEIHNKMNRKPTENNRKQAYFPKGSLILPNKYGTAPGCIMEKDKKTIIVMPGPPKEMKPMFDNYVKPFLLKDNKNILKSKVLRIIGMGESKIENDLLDLIDKQINPTIATYAKDGECTVRITAKGKNEKEVESLIEPISNEIKSRFKEKVYGEDDTAIEDEVAKILVDNNLTIAVAESCTGGMVAADLINYPGISSVFMEGCVTYSNEAKMMTLNVKKETLNTVGAVSEQCAKEMSEGVAARHNTNIGLSTTGIAGPEGGSEDKPVGLVYMGITINNKTIVKKYIFNGNRQQIRSRACKTLLNDLRLELLKII